MSLTEWDRRYGAGDYPDVGPTSLLVEIAEKLNPGSALDLACGAGRNAIWLAEHGWRVTAVDGSKTAIELLRSRRSGIETRVADLERHELEIGESCWDLIAVCYYFQRDLFEPVKRGLKPGGMALVIVHLTEPGRESRFSAEPGELARNFEGWDIVHCYEGPARDPEHRRSVAEIAARKL